MENQRFIYAQTMEYAIVETMNQCNNIQELKPILDLLLDFEKKFISMLNVIKRRVEKIIRISNNKIWSELGFAPFVLGRK